MSSVRLMFSGTNVFHKILTWSKLPIHNKLVKSLFYKTTNYKMEWQEIACMIMPIDIKLSTIRRDYGELLLFTSSSLLLGMHVAKRTSFPVTFTILFLLIYHSTYLVVSMASQLVGTALWQGTSIVFKNEGYLLEIFKMRFF